MNYSGKIIKKIKDMDVTDLDGEKVMIDFETGKYFLIKGSGNDIWELLAEDILFDDLINKLLDEFDITKEHCIEEVTLFLSRLEELGIVDVI